MDLREAALTGCVASSRHPWELARVQVVLTLLRDRVPRLFTDRAVVLDVGCGDTFLIDRLSTTMPGASFLAVDQAFTPEILARYAEKHRDLAAPIRLFRSLEEVAGAQQNPIDCVLLLDVIEHVSDDIGFLQQLRNHPGIHQDTIFLITVPAYQWLFSKHDVFLGHHRRYHRAMLSEHARRGGLTPYWTGYFFSSLLIPRIMTRLLEPPAPQSSATGIGD